MYIHVQCTKDHISLSLEITKATNRFRDDQVCNKDTGGVISPLLLQERKKEAQYTQIERKFTNSEEVHQ